MLFWLVPAVVIICGTVWFRGRREVPQSRRKPEPVQQSLSTQSEIDRWTRSALRYERENDLVKAAAVYDEALRSPLPDREARAFRHRRIEVLIMLGDAAAARKELQRLTRMQLSQFDKVRVLVHEARLSRLEGHPERALPYLDKALPLLQYDPRAVCERGIVNLDLGNLEEAVRDLSMAIKANPNDQIAHYKLAEAYTRLKRPHEAERHRREYLRIHRAALNQPESRQSRKPR